MNALEVEHLSVTFRISGRDITPVRDVSFTVPEHGRVALVGESGCGKSLTALSVRRLQPVDRARLGGRIAAPGRVAYIFQNPMDALNPVMRIGAQIMEAMPRTSRSRREMKAEVVSLLERVAIPEPERTARAYPCELSGGQQQRAMIAMALAARPDLMICDEPTTALDVTTQRQVLELIDSLASETGMAVLFITHNLGLVAKWMDWVNVLYAGEVVESGPVEEVLSSPRHPYTKGLLAAVPQLDAPLGAPLKDIPGTVPPPTAWPSGCAFHPRCPDATDACRERRPAAVRTGSRLVTCLNAN